MKLQIKKNHLDAKIPKYTIEGDAGLELYSLQDVSLFPDERKIVKTGISMKIPKSYVGLIWDKSGIAVKGGIKTMGGVIDSNYRGEVGVILKNLSDDIYEIKKGDKIAQMLIQKVECSIIEEVDELDETERGDGGFGSTGLR
ncbi:MAG: dUTP diphosphatase [Candidatus Moranbacteria bacterium]|nr:dUTP diphosphatase [Candidatus Moranbacteria bacterium]